ncbi:MULTISPECIES: aminodeoxychorismate synthase component I [Clostridium]|uniref:Anthranilate synthase component 1 n=1 Tax=Clostridium beijerinckii TaxID=1520 RepID=A0A1S9NCW6_CLOBE|nr:MULTISPECIES: aminodeoxychorismate synthase component I [Clostridium]MBN7576591.1 aminodeoxychorismate synthase component I [Clostridium beijerinckii]MBN7581620.1 aminodeoxychorismate synthase component I [Clostridium beijerinckii]MBN7586348.1 aminodeoxychorismate synthase component I [Clostridium beijerinckii]MBO0519409.1 aminodeoxychorismate synthase component I [Clostridium beijerinckii]MZK50387.1 aminodeoxychorismate synthase component I [Clostridium beijerinckii]
MIDFKIKELNTYYDPFYTYDLFNDSKDSIFLDSSKEDKLLSKYSFIGLNPYKKFISRGRKVTIDNEEYNDVDPFEKLDEIIGNYKISINSNIPFVSGAIGYFSYDIGRVLERLPDESKEDFSIPDSIFIFFDNLIIFDLQNKKTYITSVGQLEESKNSILNIEKCLKNYIEGLPVNLEKTNNEFFSNFDKEEYKKAIASLKEYIRSGDVYIANMTRRIWCNNNEKPYEIYRKLRNTNKAPFSAYMNFEDFQIISSSPERFLSIIDGKVQTRPIKGTRPRGKDYEEDERNRNELMASEKDKSELLMIVDLERNDLSKVCKPKSVKVTELFKLEEYETVFHLVATIEGRLRENVSSVKCIRECFPGGSITGAPKIRAMEIIEELEKLKRNIYTGSIGYFDLRGNSDFNIVIRTIIKKGDKAYLGVGGGITWESIEEEEWLETIDKAKALMEVL